MARLNSITEFLPIVSERPSDLDNYPIPVAQHGLDVFAAMSGRVLRWRATVSFSISGNTSYDFGPGLLYTQQSFAGNGDVVAAIVTSTAGRTVNDSENGLAEATNYLQSTETAITSGGSFSGSTTSDDHVNPPVTEIRTGGYDLSLRILWTQGPTGTGPTVIHGKDLYIGLFAEITVEQAAVPGFLNNRLTAIANRNTLGVGIPLVPCGALSIQTPNWLRGSGQQAISCPLFVRPFQTGLDAEGNNIVGGYLNTFCTVTLEPHGTPGSVLPYGLDPAHPQRRTTIDRIWREDGSAALDPLTH